ncbi:MAG: sugar ABC transporter permease [Sporichthyaceae bacterium]
MATSGAPPVVPGPLGRRAKRPHRRLVRLSRGDRITLFVMAAVPTLLVLWLVWLPGIASVVLGFFRWEGVGNFDTATWVGLDNYKNILTNYPPFKPAIEHNIIWLVALFLVPTPLGMFLAVLLDKEMRLSRFYQTALFIPVVLSLALVGFMWQLIYSPEQGLLNQITGGHTDWYGDPNINLWAVLVAVCWKQTGYVMLLYLAGLKAVDPTLREAATVDGATETQTFFRIIFPVMRPINVIVLVITFIEALRAFDLVWVINKGRNGLELISALVTQNIVGEASRIGFGSALATIMLAISSVFVAVYVRYALREEDNS